MTSPSPLAVRVVPWLLAAFALAATGCETTQVHLIAGAGTSTDAYDVLFLGAGFETDDELEAYRLAAVTLSKGILETPPYAEHSDRLRFWRIDVRGGPIGFSHCPPSTVLKAAPCAHETVVTPPPSTAPPPIETLEPEGTAVVEKDLEVSLCWTDSGTTGSCRVLWASPDGQSRAAELATLAPDIDAVIILANTQGWAGAGNQNGLSGSLPLIVAGVPQDDAGNAEGSNLVAHELAHALGLADEYSDAIGTSDVPASEFGNVWQPADKNYGPDRSSTDPSSTPIMPSDATKTIPWLGMADCTTPLDATYNCDCNDDCSDWACPRTWRPSSPSCSSCVTGAGGYDARCEKFLGLFEGAHYSSEDTYRSSWSCRMNETSSEFCAVCAEWIERFFICNYVSPGSC